MVTDSDLHRLDDVVEVRGDGQEGRMGGEVCTFRREQDEFQAEDVFWLA